MTIALPEIDPQDALALQEKGAAIIDIRSFGEHQNGHIQGALCLPAELARPELLPQREAGLIFTCRSGRRTQQQAENLAAQAAGHGPIYQLAGGLQAWQKAGLPTECASNAPLEISRQVQIGAGSLVLLGAILGATVSPGFYLLSAFVGCGLIFAGISGFCGMAILLMKMPWNRR